MHFLISEYSAPDEEVLSKPNMLLKDVTSGVREDPLKCAIIRRNSQRVVRDDCIRNNPATGNVYAGIMDGPRFKE